MRALIVLSVVTGCAAAILSCSAPASPPPGETCAESLMDEWSIVHWAMSDGTAGSTGCHGPVDNHVALHEASPPWFQINLGEVSDSDLNPGRVPLVPFPRPVCGGGPDLVIKNHELVTGATGAVDPWRSNPDFGNQAPVFFVELHVGSGPDPAAACAAGAPWLPPRSGTWEVTRGGTWGEPVEIIVRDVEYDLPDGRTFTITEGIWHTVLMAEPIIYTF